MAHKPHDLAWLRLFEGLHRSGLPLQLQIRSTVVAAIESKLLSPDTRVMPSRRLSHLLGVARNTVVGAYQQLVDEGFLASRERSGIFVAAELAVPAAPPAPPRPHAKSGDWSERFAVQPSSFRHISKPRNWVEYPFPFLSGQFDPALFPVNQWRESVRAASSTTAINGWAPDMIDEDDPDLVEQLRLHVLPPRGILVAPDEVMITIGAQQALYLIAQLFVGRHTRAGVEDPGYPDIRNLLKLNTDNLLSINVDENGGVPDQLFASLEVAFVTAGHQCPTTAVMPLARRQELLRLARLHDVVVVEDDYDADLFLEGEPTLPSLRALDPDGRVVYVGSFSKVLAPGLRLGFVVAPAVVIAELRVLRRLMLRHPPSNNQRSASMFIALGHYRSHLRHIASVLSARARLIDGLLPAALPGCMWRRDPGSTSFWINGPPGLDVRTLYCDAARAGVLIEPGDVFFASPEAGRSTFRLGFASIRTDRIEAGLAQLGKLIDPRR